MNCSDIQADSLKRFVRRLRRKGRTGGHLLTQEGAKAEVVEFLRMMAGPKSAFYQKADFSSSTSDYDTLVSLLEASATSLQPVYLKRFLQNAASLEVNYHNRQMS